MRAWTAGGPRRGEAGLEESPFCPQPGAAPGDPSGPSLPSTRQLWDEGACGGGGGGRTLKQEPEGGPGVLGGAGDLAGSLWGLGASHP